MKISIIGLGAVGGAAFKILNKFHSVTGYDIDGRGSWEDVLNSEIAMICVSTNAGENGTLDMGNVFSVAKKLSENNYNGLIMLKSTLQPGTTDEIFKKYPELNLSYVPEFLREKDAEEWFEYPDRIVYSVDDKSKNILLKCFEWVSKEVPRIRMSHLEAEFGKLAHNAFIATKVTFTCEIERIVSEKGINPNAVMEVVWRDRRIKNNAHLTPGLGGFGGKCVPKDTAALASEDPDKKSLINILHSRGSDESLRKNKQ